MTKQISSVKAVQKNRAFTLLEIVIVMAVIAILATLAIPSNVGRNNQKKILETMNLIDPYKQNIKAAYFSTGNFPEDNAQANMPARDKIIGNYLTGVTVEDGAMHLNLGNKLSIEGVLSIFPVYVKDSPASPISWVCGYDTIPEGMDAAGENKTNIKKLNLPGRCW